MNAKLFEIVFERLAESQPSGEESNLVLSACHGTQDLLAELRDCIGCMNEFVVGVQAPARRCP